MTDAHRARHRLLDPSTHADGSRQICGAGSLAPTVTLEHRQRPIMFNNSYSVSSSSHRHSHYNDGPSTAPEDRSSSNRYHHDDRYSQEQYNHQQSSRPSYDNHGPPPSHSSRDQRNPSSSSGSLRRKSQADWSRPRGSAGPSSLRPTTTPVQRPPPNDENAAVLDRMKAAGWVGVGERGSGSGQGEEEGVYPTHSHGSMDSGYGSGCGGDEGKSGMGLGSWSALKKAVGLGEEEGGREWSPRLPLLLRKDQI